MADRSFAAERVNISFVPDHTPAPPAAALRRPASLHDTLTDTTSGTVRALQIPRRPRWDTDVPLDELHRAEKNAFLEWRRHIAAAEAELGGGIVGGGVAVTPFEKNLEVWRQLWRVVERSDVLVQIVDARNPLLFHSEDLDAYVREVSADKRCLLLVNKADYLSAAQRLEWARYLTGRGLRFVFFSARRELDRLEALDRAQAAYRVGAPLAADMQELARPWGMGGDDGGAPPSLAATSGDAKLVESMRRAFLAAEEGEDDDGSEDSRSSDGPSGGSNAAAGATATIPSAAAQSDEVRAGDIGGKAVEPLEGGPSAPCPASDAPVDAHAAGGTAPEAAAREAAAGDASARACADDPLSSLIHILSREELLDFLQASGALRQHPPPLLPAALPLAAPTCRPPAQVCRVVSMAPARPLRSGASPSSECGSGRRRWRHARTSCDAAAKWRRASSRWGWDPSSALLARSMRWGLRATRKMRPAAAAMASATAAAARRRRPR